jgi:hypothetical protein
MDFSILILQQKTLMSVYEIGSIIVAFIALVISILTFAQSSISTILNQRQIDKANEIAQKALDLTMHDHKTKILPTLSATYIIYNLPHNGHPLLIQFLLSNTNHSTATLKQIKSYGMVSIETEDGSPIPFPVTLRLNYPFIFIIKILPMVLHDWRKKNLDLIQEANRTVMNSLFVAVYEDELLNPYQTNLRYNTSSKKFEGIPMEMPKDIS